MLLNNKANKVFQHYSLSLILIALLAMIMPNFAEAGLLSTLAKLGKKVDAPDVHVSAFRFADDLHHYPDGGVAEISFSHSQNQWLAKTPDGQSVSVQQFASSTAAAKKQTTLLLSERNLPYSLAAFNKLPADANIIIKTRQGKSFSLAPGTTTAQLIDRHIRIDVTDVQTLKTVLWQLQRPVTSTNMRLVRLADDPERILPSQNYGSKVVIDTVGANRLLTAIAAMRQQTLVISAEVENGLLRYGKQHIAIADLEKAAADRDVTLIILGSDKPKKTLQQLAKDWQQRKDSGALLSFTSGDFYNAFAPKNATAPIPVEIASSGQLRTALHFEQTPAKMNPSQMADTDLVLLPLHVLAKSATLLRPSEARSEELDNRIHPLIPSWLHLAVIASLAIGVFTLHTSWFLFQKIWTSPYRINFSNRFSFSLCYVLHRLTFITLYLPLLGFASPIYLLVKWTYYLIQLFFIRPAQWLFNKLS